MKCAYHPRRNAAAVCVNCGKFICAECKSELGGKSYCTTCANEIFVTRKQAEEVEIPVEAIQPTTVVAELQATKTKPQGELPTKKSDIVSPGKNWFERHLNWTLGLIGFAGAFLILQACMSIGFDNLGYLLGCALMIWVTFWYIKKKGRSYKHLLWLIIPAVGQIILLYLANHRFEEAVVPGISSVPEVETTEEDIKTSRAKLSEALSPVTAAASTEHIKKPSKKLLAVIGSVAAVAIILLIVMLIPEPDYVPSKGTSPPAQPSPAQSTPAQPVLQNVNQVNLSSQQLEIVDSFGWPHSFSIFEMKDENDLLQRLDTWTYFDSGITFVFLNGEFVNTESSDSLSPGFIVAPYKPNQFVMGASPDEVCKLAIGSEWVGMPGVDNFIEGGGLYVAQQLVTAFSENRLVFVEALAIVPEGSN